MSSDIDSSDFGKQRRNLMLISTLIYMHDFLSIDYSNFSLWGITIQNPEKAPFVLAALWIYFFIRFFNFAPGFNGIGISELKAFKENHTRRSLIRKYKKKLSLSQNTSVSFPHETMSGSIFKGYSSTMYHLTNGQRSPETTIKTSIFKEFLFSIRSLAKLSIRTKYVTEYWLPFVYSTLPTMVFLK